MMVIHVATRTAAIGTGRASEAGLALMCAGRDCGADADVALPDSPSVARISGGRFRKQRQLPAREHRRADAERNRAAECRPPDRVA